MIPLHKIPSVRALVGLCLLLLGLLLWVVLTVARPEPSAWAAPLEQNAIQRGNQTIPPPQYLPALSKAPAPINLSNNAAMDERPVWSPDGTQIAFFSNRDGQWSLYTMEGDGANVQELPLNLPPDLAEQGSFVNDPRWSPDGTKIAIVLTRPIAVTPRGPFLTESHLFVVGVDGTTATFLKSVTGETSITFDWSPDSTRLVYGGVGPSLVVVETNASNPVEVGELLPDYVAGVPDWSPDGNQIVFGGLFADGIYLVNADGSNQRRIFYDPLTSSNYREAMWSPDGTRLVMRLTQDYVRTTNLEGGDLRELDDISWDFLSLPQWSRDGAHLAFFGAPLNPNLPVPLPTFLYVVGSELGTSVKVAANAFGTRDGNPSWSPDGKRIVYASAWDRSNSDIFVIELGPLPTNENALAPASQLGVTVDESLRIVEITADGAADLANLQVGDLLIDLALVEGATVHEAIPFTDREEVKQLIARGERVRLRFERGGTEQEVTLQTTPPAPRPGLPTPTPVTPPADYF